MRVALHLIAMLSLLASCTRRLPNTPSFLVIPATAASCETLPMSSTGRILGECRYTVEDQAGIHVRRIEFLKAK